MALGFLKRDTTVEKKSHWDRLDPNYHRLCERIVRKSSISPRNRGVRLIADLWIANNKPFHNFGSRQQAKRGGQR